MKVQMGKHYQMADGRPVRIYAVEDKYVHGAYQERGEKKWNTLEWGRDGGFLCSTLKTHMDLVEVKPRIERWVVLYSLQEAPEHIIPGIPYSSRADAAKCVRDLRRAGRFNITVTYLNAEVGQGLEDFPE